MCRDEVDTCECAVTNLGATRATIDLYVASAAIAKAGHTTRICAQVVAQYYGIVAGDIDGFERARMNGESFDGDIERANLEAII